MSEEKRVIKYKNPIMVYVFGFLTMGIYSMVWQIKSKRDLVALGADIPTSWLLIVPFANLYWVYKYVTGYTQVKDGKASVGFFLLCALTPFGIAFPYLLQSFLNEHAEGEEQKAIAEPSAA